MNNPVLATIRERRSIRNYSNKKVTSDLLEIIIHAGKYAPSAEDRQPWKFIVVTNPHVIQSLSQKVKQQIVFVLKHKWKWKHLFPELNDKKTAFFLMSVSQSKDDNIFHNAPVLIFIVTTDQTFNDESCACAAQNMMLAAWSLGIGSCWIGFAKFLEVDAAILTDLRVPEEHHIAAALTFGYPHKIPKTTFRKPLSTIIHRIDDYKS